MGMMKFARASGWKQTQPLKVFDPQIKQADVRHQLDPNCFYLDDWSVSAYEDYGPNDNGDGFERAELKKAYKTFEGSWVCLDHQNYDERLKIGTNVDAVYTPQNYVKVLMAVNKKEADRRHPGLQNKIVMGEITDTSMGAWCKLSVCSVCGNKANDASEFCSHVRPPLRMTVICNANTGWKEITACELNRGVVFFENSIITDSDGADGRAKIIEVLASRVQPGISGDRLYKVLHKLASEVSGEQEKMLLAHIINEVSRVMDEGE